MEVNMPRPHGYRGNNALGQQRMKKLIIVMNNCYETRKQLPLTVPFHFSLPFMKFIEGADSCAVRDPHAHGI